MTRILVTGGTGTLGSALVPRLVARGHEVRSLSRHGAPTADPDAGADTDAKAASAAGVSQVRGDVRSGEGLDRALTDIDVVIHAATSGSTKPSKVAAIETSRLPAAKPTNPAAAAGLWNPRRWVRCRNPRVSAPMSAMSTP